MPEVVLRIGQYEVRGWQSVQVQRSLDAAADSFDIALTSPLSSAPPPVPVREGDAVALYYGSKTDLGEQLLSGYIDEVDETSTASSFNLRISGRSKAKDLVDCSALHKGAWRNKTIVEIAGDIAAPFGLDVTSDVEPVQERYFRLQDSETAFDAIDRLVRSHGMRCVSYPNGGLLLTRTGLVSYPDVAIERGVNVVEGGVRRSENDRYSEYIFKATLAAADDDYGDGNATKFAVVDEGVERYRPLIVHLDGQRATGKSNKVALKEQAEWERNTRAGASQKLSYRVLYPGDVARSWEMPNNRGLWTPNTIVTVRDRNHAVDGLFLITSVTLSRSSSGTTTQLDLTHPEAYQPEKPPKKKLKKGGVSW